MTVPKAAYLVEAHLVEGRPVAELAAAHGCHRSWIYKLLARYQAEGEAGLIPRSKAPHHPHYVCDDAMVREIVTLRKRLQEDGFDAGALTIYHHLERDGFGPPSPSSIWRVLKREGFVNPQPKKRPKASYVRFAAALPNECWQSDMTHTALANGTGVEIINIIDDHSRLAIASVVVPVARSVDVVRIFTDATKRYGVPASFLSDNGAIYTARFRGGRGALPSELERLGVTEKHSTPYHPQTCGKVERFHQTLKRHLARGRGPTTIPELQARIDRFCEYYNNVRPHRSLGSQTPWSVYAKSVKAHPKMSLPPPTTGCAMTRSIPQASSAFTTAASSATLAWERDTPERW
ncbi:MAG: IS481 family transposase [Acidimicrobiales bacterium]